MTVFSIFEIRILFEIYIFANLSDINTSEVYLNLYFYLLWYNHLTRLE